METLDDFPKIQCPFIRQTFLVSKDHFKQAGSRTGLYGEAKARHVRLVL